VFSDPCAARSIGLQSHFEEYQTGRWGIARNHPLANRLDNDWWVTGYWSGWAARMTGGSRSNIGLTPKGEALLADAESQLAPVGRALEARAVPTNPVLVVCARPQAGSRMIAGNGGGTAGSWRFRIPFAG
jgi:hypothetical protein